MNSVDKIRSGLIDKIRLIQNEDFLMALEKNVSLNSLESQRIKLNKDQKEMLEMSEDDIKQGKVISQEAMYKRNLE